MTKIISIFLAVFLVTIPATSDEVSIDQDEVSCLARNIYHEARGESVAGMLAVAHVTLNRLFHNNFPGSICEVVYQQNQFSWTRSKKKRSVDVPESFTELALHVIMGKSKDNTNGALFFHNTTLPQPKKRVKARIGNHIFY